MKYVLHYFKVPGKGEICRFLLAASAADWENVYIQSGPKGMDMNLYPSGLVPWLYVHDTDGSQAFRMGESRAIARHLTASFGRRLANETLDALSEGVLDIVDGMVSAIGQAMVYDVALHPDYPNSKPDEDTLVAKLRPSMAYFEKIYAKHSGGNWLIGSQADAGLADAAVAFLVENIRRISYGEQFLEEFPNVLKVGNNFLRLEPVAKYIASREHNITDESFRELSRTYMLPRLEEFHRQRQAAKAH